MKAALILVDIQNDFLPGGALAVPQGDEVIPVANRLIDRFDCVIATQDWHPKNHESFASQHEGHEVGQVIQLQGLEQILWPNHCVQGTHGAEFAATLNRPEKLRVFPKGTDRNIDSYSGFFDNGQRKSTGLGAYLKTESINRVYILGLATDYCVKFTALDAKQLGFETYLVEDGCRGVDLATGDSAIAVREMQFAGIQSIQSETLLAQDT